MSLAAGNFQGRVGHVIAPMSGLSGSSIRRQAMNIAVGNLGGLGSTCGTVNSISTATTAAMGIASLIGGGGKALTTAADIVGKASSVAGAVCPPAVSNTSPATTAAADTSAQLAAAQQQLADANALVIANQNAAARTAALSSRTSKSFTQTLTEPKTLLMIGGGIALVGAAWFLLRK